jgi:N-acetylglutamate synthase-like GNAT family acetyltransferase
MIEVNNRSHLEAFIALNEAWISKYFTLEEADIRLASNPGQVIDNGGYIFSLAEDNRVVGVCALFRESAEVFQLARMAVDFEFQGRGYGDVLIRSALSTLEAIKARKVYLLSNSRLEAAISLYLKHGFEIVSHGKHPDYSRVDIVMEKCLL